MNMRPVVYNWKSGDNTRMNGFLAQEVEQIVPEAVVAPKTADEHYGMKYEALIPVLTKAIQEQQTMIDLMKKQLEAQQQLIDKLGKQKDRLK